jgi:hypothetical protein
MDKRQVYLGGACGNTTWRQEIAIPMLEAADITYYDPQLGFGEWTEDFEATEMRYKNMADVMLWVISDETRSVASVAEAAYYIAGKFPLALALKFLPDDAMIDGKPISAIERDDLNRGRIFVRTMAQEHGIPIFENISDAAQYAIDLVRKQKTLTLGDLNTMLGEINYKHHRFMVETTEGGFFIRTRCEEPDIRNGEMAVQFGRRWFIPNNTSRGDVVRTAFKAIMTWEEHEVREYFLYRGQRIFDPHFDLDDYAAYREIHVTDDEH